MVSAWSLRDLEKCQFELESENFRQFWLLLVNLDKILRFCCNLLDLLMAGQCWMLQLIDSGCFWFPLVAPDCSCLPLDSSSTVVSWSDVQAVPDCSWLLLASLGSRLAATGCSWLLLACPQLLLPVCSSKFRLLASPGCCSPGLHSRILAPNSSLHNFCVLCCCYCCWSFCSSCSC